MGVFRGYAEARIDGNDAWREVASTQVRSEGNCVPLRETDYLFEFAAPAPCPPAVESAQLVLDRGALPVGTHELRVQVQDAAGNSTVVLPAKTYIVPKAPVTTVSASAPPAEPRPAVAPAATSSAVFDTAPTAQFSILTPSSRRVASTTFRLTGRLLDLAGNPIANAIVAIHTRPYFPNAGTAACQLGGVGNAMPDATGEFRTATLAVIALDPGDLCLAAPWIRPYSSRADQRGRRRERRREGPSAAACAIDTRYSSRERWLVRFRVVGSSWHWRCGSQTVRSRWQRLAGWSGRPTQGPSSWPTASSRPSGPRHIGSESSLTRIPPFCMPVAPAGPSTCTCAHDDAERTHGHSAGHRRDACLQEPSPQPAQ